MGISTGFFTRSWVTANMKKQSYRRNIQDFRTKIASLAQEFNYIAWTLIYNNQEHFHHLYIYFIFSESC